MHTPSGQCCVHLCARILSTSFTSVSIFSAWCYSSVQYLSQWYTCMLSYSIVVFHLCFNFLSLLLLYSIYLCVSGTPLTDTAEKRPSTILSTSSLRYAFFISPGSSTWAWFFFCFSATLATLGMVVSHLFSPDWTSLLLQVHKNETFFGSDFDVLFLCYKIEEGGKLKIRMLAVDLLLAPSCHLRARIYRPSFRENWVYKFGQWCCPQISYWLRLGPGSIPSRQYLSSGSYKIYKKTL